MRKKTLRFTRRRGGGGRQAVARAEAKTRNIFFAFIAWTYSLFWPAPADSAPIMWWLPKKVIDQAH